MDMHAYGGFLLLSIPYDGSIAYLSYRRLACRSSRYHHHRAAAWVDIAGTNAYRAYALYLTC